MLHENVKFYITVI